MPTAVAEKNRISPSTGQPVVVYRDLLKEGVRMTITEPGNDRIGQVGTLAGSIDPEGYATILFDDGDAEDFKVIPDQASVVPTANPLVEGRVSLSLDEEVVVIDITEGFYGEIGTVVQEEDGGNVVVLFADETTDFFSVRPRENELLGAKLFEEISSETPKRGKKEPASAAAPQTKPIKRLRAPRTARPLPEVLAVEAFKANGSDPRLLDIGSVLSQYIEDKGFDPGAVISLSRSGNFGLLLSGLVARLDSNAGGAFNQMSVLANYNGERFHLLRKQAPLGSYRGTHIQNARIDRALTSNPELRRPKWFFGQGASTILRPDITNVRLPDEVRAIPIAIIGYGASGILAAETLRQLGFTNVRVYEKREALGIWSQANVSGRSRNNPRDIDFFTRHVDAAPGDGAEVSSFLSAIAENSRYKRLKVEVTEVIPGDLDHQVKFTNGDSQRFPIVINAMGLGKPVPLSDPDRMVTDASTSEAGSRWQQTLERKQVEGKRLIFIGLGNSTAEMLRQVHDFIDDGIQVDYRILTHYPEDSVSNPDNVVFHKGREYRIFRDVSRPNLVDYQGDLPQSRSDYFRALRDGKIISGVRRWTVDGAGKLGAYNDADRLVDVIPYDRIYSLTGYKHDEASLTKMGCAYDREDRCALFDYDGEITANPTAKDPKKRMRRGYYGLGPMLETPYNPNAIVIPGTLFRMGDMAFSVIMRAVEYNLAQTAR
ncbi:MAG: hypothetical protein ACAH35_05720 [Candidatus Paceibacterota bacterium]